MKKITVQQAREMLLSKYAHPFYVTFYKKDGSERVMNCELRYPKESYSPAPHEFNPNLITVGDLDIYRELIADGWSDVDATNKSYRSINTLTLKSIEYDGEHYEVE